MPSSSGTSTRPRSIAAGSPLTGAACWDLAFTPDGKVLATASNDTESRIVGEKPEKGSMRLWDVATGRERHRFPVEGFDVRSVAFSPDGQAAWPPASPTRRSGCTT